MDCSLALAIGIAAVTTRRPISESRAGELRGALFQERAHPFAHVGGRSREAEVRRLERQCVVERHVEPAIDRVDAEGHRAWGLRKDGLKELARRRQQLSAWKHCVDETDAQRFVRVDDLPSQEKLQRSPSSNQTGKPLRSAITGRDAELHLGLAELCRFGGDAEVTGHGQLAAATQRKPVHCGERRLRRRLEPAEHGLAGERAALGLGRGLLDELSDVSAGDECATGAGQQHGAHIVARACFVNGAAELRDRRVVEGVQFVGAAHRDGRNAIGDLEGEVLVGHGPNLKTGTAFCAPVAFAMTRKWIRRVGSKASGFRYADDKGRIVRDRRTIARIEALRVPPAWRDVHIATNATAAIQAWGFDARGRRQYRYHTRAAQRGQLRKYYRVRAMGHELPRIRAAIHRASRARALDRDSVAAVVLRLVSEGLFRPGSDEATRENSTFGITTMRKSHVELDGECLVFRYVAKGGKRLRQCVISREIARSMRRLLATPGRRLFRYRAADGSWRNLTARDVNQYLRRALGLHYSVKDFRTWGGTLRAAIVLAELGPSQSEADAKRRVAQAMRLVAADLGNTPAICRKSYVHPMVIARYVDEGETISVSRRVAAQSRSGHSADERALLAFLDRHFPERRRKVRAVEERRTVSHRRAA